MIVSIIAAMSRNRVIGKDGGLPWHLPADLKRFKRLTTGHPVVMGRRTFESDSGLLPNRDNIILTRRADYAVDGARVCASLDEALRPYRDTDEEVFICGGAAVYEEALAFADRIYLTVIHRDYAGDTFFPEIPAARFETSAREDFDDPLPFSFLTLARRVS